MSNEITKTQEQSTKLISIDNGEFSCYLDTAKFNQLYRAANLFSQSELVPAHYQQKPQNCFIAMQMAIRLDVDPLMFMQNTYVVHGKPGMEAKLAIALINSRGPFRGPIQWKFEGSGKSIKCTAYATHKATKEICEATVSWDMAEKEGWVSKSGSKWKTMPDLMFRYRSAVFLGRLYAPECLMGMSTVDELVDIGNTTVVDADALPEHRTEGLAARLTNGNGGNPAPAPEPATKPKPTSKAAEQTHKLAEDLQSKSVDMLLEMSNGDPESMADVVLKASSFTDKDGKEVVGKGTLEAVSDKAMPAVYGRIKEQFAEWQNLTKDGPF